MKFVVRYSPKLDLQNYLERVWRYNPQDLYGRDPKRFLKQFPENFQHQIDQATTKQQATIAIINYWHQTRSINFNQLTKKSVYWTERIINNEKENIIKLLEKIYQRPFPFNKITVYLTTLPICPFNYRRRWFMIQRNKGFPHLLSTSLHELNHFMFYYYYFNQLKKRNIDLHLIDTLREALAILSNPEGNDKPEVYPLEQFIKKHHRNKIDTLIELSVNFLIKNHATPSPSLP